MLPGGRAGGSWPGENEDEMESKIEVVHYILLHVVLFVGVYLFTPYTQSSAKATHIHCGVLK